MTQRYGRVAPFSTAVATCCVEPCNPDAWVGGADVKNSKSSFSLIMADRRTRMMPLDGIIQVDDVSHNNVACSSYAEG